MKRLIYILILIGLASTSIFAQKQFNSRELYSLNRVSEFSASPDGKWILYKLSVPNIEDNKIYHDLYAVSIDGKETIRLTDDKASEFNAIWSPDGKKIAYLSTKDGAPQIYVMKFPTKEVEKISNLENGVNTLAWSPDGKYFAITSDVKILKTPKDKYPELSKAKIRIYENVPVRHWDEWVDENYSHLLLLPAQGGEAIDLMPNEAYDTPLKPFGGAEEISWSPDSKEVAYTCKKLYGIEFVNQTNSDIYVYNIDSKTTKNITQGMMGYDKAPLYSPDGKYIAFYSMEHNGFESDKNRLMLFDRTNSKVTDLSAKLDQWAEEKIWAKDSKSLFITATDSGIVSIFHIDLNANSKRISEGIYDFGSGLDITDDGKLVFGVQNINMPLDIFTMPAKGGKMTQVTFSNKDFSSKFKPSKIEQRWVTAKDGKKIHVWLIFPPDFDPNKKYPMITYCQGGPQSMISQRFHYRWNFYLMASHGYIVMAPNRRGVPGFGQDWNDAISKDWGGMPMQDILSATDEIAKESYVDKDGLCAIGASAGGYTTFWLAGNHNKRFKAFLAHCGVFNLESMYGSTEELWFPNWEYNGPYWDGNNMSFYDKNSPHNFAKNWDTPIIISTGERDFRVPYTQSLEAFTVAQVKKIPSKLIAFPDETHFISKIQEFMIWDNEVFDFLDRFTKRK